MTSKNINLTAVQMEAYKYVKGTGADGVTFTYAKEKHDVRVLNNLVKSGALKLDGEKLFANDLPEASTKANGEKKAKPAKAEKKAKAPREKKAKGESVACLCGCGEMTNPGRLFVQGHDMKLRSAVMQVFKEKAPKSSIPSRRQATMDYLKDAHWMTKEVWAAIS